MVKRALEPKRKKRRLFQSRRFFSRLLRRPFAKARLPQSAQNRRNLSKEKHGRIDTLLLGMIVFLLIFGLIMVFDASVVFSYAYFGDKYKFIVQQLIWAGIGIGVMLLATVFPYKNYKKLSLPLLVATAGLLVVVIVFGQTVSGAQRWLDLGKFAIQPSEIAKLTYIIYLAVWLSKERNVSTWKDYIYSEFLPFLGATALITGLVIAGRDMGTATVILLVSFVMYFMSAKTKIQKKGVLMMLALGVLAVVIFAVSEPYRMSRIVVFWDLLKGEIRSPTNEGYQIFQVLIAIGSGGLFGTGFTGSLQKYDLVETTAATDSIFAIVGEELGFFVCIALIILYLAIFMRGIKIAERTPDKMGAMLAAGISVWIGVQAFINIGANIGLVPLTGLPLPLISYGGSALVTLMAGLGVLLNVSRARIKTKTTKLKT